MGPVAIRQVSVWLDGLAPLGGAFAHALEWARRLGLPVSVSSAPTRKPSHRATGWFASTFGSAHEADDRCFLTDKLLSACADACRRSNVAWKSPTESAATLVRTTIEDAGQLWVFGSSLPSETKEYLLWESLQSASTPALVCPTRCAPQFRVLVLLKDWDHESFYLDSAIQVCRALGTMPVVLSIGRSEDEAKAQQDHAEAVFASRKMPAFFDLIAGWNVRTAISAVARWRRCNHIFVEQRHTLCSWRWIRCGAKHDLFSGSNALTVLSLPSAPLAVSSAAPTEVQPDESILSPA